MIWLLFLLVLLPVAFLILKGGRQDDSQADPVSHYRRQLRELDADVKKGLQSEEEAAGARLEIERRILALAANQEEHEKRVVGRSSSPKILLGLAFLATFALYLKVGSPSAQSVTSQSDSLMETKLTEDGLTYGEAIKKINAHLRDNPRDIEGWDMLARSARSVGAHFEATNALSQLVALEPDNLDWRIQQLESFIAMSRGKVSPASQMLVQEILGLDAGNPAGHYYLGLSRLQAGDRDAARMIWTSLAERSPDDAPWMAALRGELARLGAVPPRLSQEQRDMVADMSEEERSAFVNSMIERLEARLESNPDDAQGWLMLARSKVATGQKEAAISDLTRALTLVGASSQPQLQAFLDNLQQSPNP